MTELWLVRHGQTDWNLQGRYQGQSDVPLNETGRAQARNLAARLYGQRFAVVYSSDLSRARETAEILATNLNLPLHIDQRLREICQGEWEGLQVKEITERYNIPLSLTQPRPIEARAPGGESVWEVAARMVSVVNDIIRAYPLGPVLVVSHGLAVSALYCEAKKLSLAEAYQHIPQNVQPVVIRWSRT